MKILQILLIFILALQIVYSKDTLKYIGSIFRHGARGTIYKLLNWDTPYNKHFFAQLTATGMRQHYTLGQALRERYIEGDKLGLGLKPNYDHQQMYVRSSDVNRTINSAYSQLNGLYPPGTGPRLPKDLPDYLPVAPYKEAEKQEFGTMALPYTFQNIPVHNVPVDQDTLLRPNKGSCPKIKEIHEKYETTEPGKSDIAKVNEKYKKQMQQLTELFNFKEPLELKTMESLYDVLIADKFNGQPTENWDKITPELWQAIYELDSLWWMTYETTPEVGTIIASRVLLSWLEYSDIILGTTEITDPKKDHLKKLKYTMYSCHDDNVIGMQYALGMTTFDCLWKKFNGEEDPSCYVRPYFAASLIYELYQPEEEGAKPYVKILYNGEYILMCGSKDQKQCSLEDFRKYVHNFVYQPDGELKADVYCGRTEQKEQDYASFLEMEPQQKYVSENGEEQNENSSEFLNILVILGFIAFLTFAAFIIAQKISAKNTKNTYQFQQQQNTEEEQTNQNILKV